MAQSTSLSAHKLSLARELLDDIELSRLAPEALLLKASRLARLVEDADTVRWLQWELEGYTTSPESQPWIQRFGRLVAPESGMGYFMPLAGIQGLIQVMQTQIQSLQVPSIQFSPSSANPNEMVTGFAGITVQSMLKPAKDVMDRLQTLTTAVSNLTSIRSRVLSAMHSFAVQIYHELAFTGLAESIFEAHRGRIDSILAKQAPEAIEKIPSIYARLSEGDGEAISQAMNSVRRIIKTVADALYPPTDQARELGGERYELGSDKVLNRLKLYLLDHCTSKSRVDRLARTIRAVHERVSTGAHSEITPEEAASLFLSAYLTLGEIIMASSA